MTSGNMIHFFFSVCFVIFQLFQQFSFIRDWENNFQSRESFNFPREFSASVKVFFSRRFFFPKKVFDVVVFFSPVVSLICRDFLAIKGRSRFSLELLGILVSCRCFVVFHNVACSSHEFHSGYFMAWLDLTRGLFSVR